MKIINNKILVEDEVIDLEDIENNQLTANTKRGRSPAEDTNKDKNNTKIRRNNTSMNRAANKQQGRRNSIGSAVTVAKQQDKAAADSPEVI